ncbi:MAG: biotin/lipoyl-binding protein [Clostridia bacterium]|nr:biotin/lipoyl-binding protein [Clostridia bacterium]
MAKKYIVTVNGVSYEVVVEDADPNAVYNAAPAEEKKPEPAPAAAPAAPAAPASAAPADGLKINAPLPGNILKVEVAAGASVKKGDVLCILEAMKMENEIVAPQDGVIKTVAAVKGSSVNTGDLLFVIG